MVRSFLFQRRIIPSEKNGPMIIGRSIHGMWGIEYKNGYQSSGDYVEKMWRGALRSIEFKKRSYEIPNLPFEIKFKPSILTSFFFATIGETKESEFVWA